MSVDTLIKRLTFARENLCVTCTYDDILEEAITALEATRPRVMTVDEVKAAIKGPVWLEQRNDAAWALIYGESGGRFFTRFADGGVYLPSGMTYGKEWRCWTGKPTKKEMEVFKWHD